MVGTVPTEFPPLQTSLSGEAYRRKVNPILRKFVLPNGKNLEPWKERGRNMGGGRMTEEVIERLKCWEVKRWCIQ